MGDRIRIGVFIYDYPNYRSNNFFIALSNRYHIDTALAAPYKNLHLPYPSYTISEDKTTIAPKCIYEALKIPCLVAPHESSECIAEIKKRKLDIGIVAGARILPAEVINAFKIGVINFHPGLLPFNRGLDAMRWAIYNNIPQGVTAHWIDKRVDAGSIIKSITIDVYKTDTMPDIASRLFEAQIELLEALPKDLKKLLGAKVHTKMTKTEEHETLKRFKKYKEEYKNEIGDGNTKIC